MADAKRIKNVVGISETLWELNKFRVLEQIEAISGAPVPEDCYELIECSFRLGAVLMERALGKRANNG